jgi:predicted 3-demethylubiquinone-9 3-methyltransferase (glyoxalase superfamily)
MSNRPTPCLWFDGTAEQAAEFYVGLFPHSRIISVSRYGEAGPLEAGTAMMVEFELDGQPFSGLNGGPQFTFNEAVSFQIPCADQAEVDHYWDAFAEGGDISMCGWVRDRFGLWWQVVPDALNRLAADPDPVKAQAVVAAMLQMRKLVVAELQAAYDAADGN